MGQVEGKVNLGHCALVQQGDSASLRPTRASALVVNVPMIGGAGQGAVQGRKEGALAGGLAVDGGHLDASVPAGQMAQRLGGKVHVRMLRGDEEVHPLAAAFDDQRQIASRKLR